MNSDLIPYSKSFHVWYPTCFSFQCNNQVFHQRYTLVPVQSLPAVMTLVSSPGNFVGAAQKQRSSSVRNFLRFFRLPSKVSGKGILGSLALTMYWGVSVIPDSILTQAAGGVLLVEDTSSYVRFLLNCLAVMALIMR